jgi:hypothetical protein
MGLGEKRIAILQSNYIPWKGYFDMINMVDEFILYDDAQYTKNDWRNRNKIKTPNGVQWITIPVKITGRFQQRIRDAEIAESNWANKHWKTLCWAYSKTKGFGKYRDLIGSVYDDAKETFLSNLNHRFIDVVCSILRIETKISWSMDYKLVEGKNERLIGICQQAGAGIYLSGPAAKEYIDEKAFLDAGIQVEFMDYSGYPEYTQLHPPFEHGVSILDLIFNEGPDAPRFMKSFWGDRHA